MSNRSKFTAIMSLPITWLIITVAIAFIFGYYTQNTEKTSCQQMGGVVIHAINGTYCVKENSILDGPRQILNNFL